MLGKCVCMVSNINLVIMQMSYNISLCRYYIICKYNITFLNLGTLLEHTNLLLHLGYKKTERLSDFHQKLRLIGYVKLIKNVNHPDHGKLYGEAIRVFSVFFFHIIRSDRTFLHMFYCK